MTVSPDLIEAQIFITFEGNAKIIYELDVILVDKKYNEVSIREDFTSYT